MEDQKIIELIRNRQQDKVFMKLYNYYPVVEKMILANGGRSEDAEDIYQEALLVFYKKAGSADFRLTSSINTYLYSISRFMWGDQLKKKRNLAYVPMTEDPLVTEFVPEIEAQELYKPAEKAIQELGARCKELLILFYYKSMKLKDIASKMGYNSENTAKNQKYKCLEAAKNKLKAFQTN